MHKRGGAMNWKAIDSQTLRNLAKDRFGEALKIDDLTDKEIAEEMDAYDQMSRAKHERKARCRNNVASVNAASSIGRRTLGIRAATSITFCQDHEAVRRRQTIFCLSILTATAGGTTCSGLEALRKSSCFW
jgi:hypothetical protein